MESYRKTQILSLLKPYTGEHYSKAKERIMFLGLTSLVT